MRTLKFIVDGQVIRQDPNCDFNDLVPGTEGYLQAEFVFSSEWNGYARVAGFFSILGKEYTPHILKDGKTCVIPQEALERRAFKIRVIGKKGNSKITTNKVTVYQKGGMT